MVMIRLTHAIIEQGMSEGGGWNRKQLAVLGISWPPKAGWKSRIVGRDYQHEVIDLFLSLRGTAGRAKRKSGSHKNQELNEAALQAFDALVGACVSEDSVIGKARIRLRKALVDMGLI